MKKESDSGSHNVKNTICSRGNVVQMWCLQLDSCLNGNTPHGFSPFRWASLDLHHNKVKLQLLPVWCQPSFSSFHSKVLPTESACVSALTNTAAFCLRFNQKAISLSSLAVYDWSGKERPKRWTSRYLVPPIECVCVKCMCIFRCCPPPRWVRDTVPWVTFPSAHREDVCWH